MFLLEFLRCQRLLQLFPHEYGLCGHLPHNVPWPLSSLVAICTLNFPRTQVTTTTTTTYTTTYTNGVYGKREAVVLPVLGKRQSPPPPACLASPYNPYSVSSACTCGVSVTSGRPVTAIWSHSTSTSVRSLQNLSLCNKCSILTLNADVHHSLNDLANHLLRDKRPTGPISGLSVLLSRPETNRRLRR